MFTRLEANLSLSPLSLSPSLIIVSTALFSTFLSARSLDFFLDSPPHFAALLI
jgi:hypothetical protein